MSEDTKTRIILRELSDVINSVRDEDVSSLRRRFRAGLTKPEEGLKERFEGYRKIIIQHLPKSENLHDYLDIVDEVLSYFSD